MIIFTLVLAYLGLQLVASLMADQDVKHKEKVENDRRKRELNEALRTQTRSRY